MSSEREMRAKIVTTSDTKEIDKTIDKYEELGAKATSTQKTLKSFGSSLKSTVSQFLALAKTIDSLTRYTDDFIASQNVLNQTFGAGTSEINDYAKNLSEMTGIANVDIAKKSALFGQMAKSLGMTNDVAKDFVIQLDDMSAKLALLYNQDFNTMAKALLDAVKGESSTLASLTGNVLKTGGLQATLDEMGINAQASALTGANRAMLEYITIARQLNATNEQMGVIVNDVAWQKRLLKSQVKELAEAFGNLLYPILKSILPVINGVLIALRYIINAIAGLLGFTGKASTGVSEVADGFNDLAGGITATDKAIKKLRGFDKLNNLMTSLPSTGGLGGLGGIGNALSKEMAKVNQEMLNIRNKAQEIAEKIMHWLGWTQDANGEWKLTNLTLGGIVTTAGLILGAMKSVNGVLGVLGKFGLVAKGTTLLGVLKSIGGVISAVVSSPAGLVALFTGFSILAEKAWQASDSLDKASNKLSVWGGSTAETKVHIQNVQGAIDDLQARINYFSYSGLKLSEKDFTDIMGSLATIKSSFNTELDNWYLEQKQKLDELYSWEGATESEAYQKRLKELQTHVANAQQEFNNYYSEYEKKLKEFYNNDGKISSKERLILLDIQDKMQKLSIESFAKNNKEATKMLENYLKHKDEMTTKQQLASLKEAREHYDTQLKDIDDYYTKQKKLAKTTYGEDTKEYKKYMNDLKLATENMRTEATAEYDKFYNSFVETNDNIADYVDKSTGTIKAGYLDLFGGIDGAIIGLKASSEGTLIDWMQEMKETVDANKGEVLSPFQKGAFLKSSNSVGKSVGDEFVKGFNSSIKNNKVSISVNATGTGPSIKINGKADGGFVDSGQMFVARENGLPEMVGQIGHKTAVANNDQIVSAIASGVARANMATKGNQKVVIEAQGDSSGLLDFITFKQKERDRQYGL